MKYIALIDHGPNWLPGKTVHDVPDELSARAIMDADPAVMAGVMTYEIKTLRVYFDTHDKTRS